MKTQQITEKVWVASLAVALTWALAGCTEPTPAPRAPQKNGDAAHDDEHGHPEEGPHHGELVELGNEEYHAEVVHANGGRLTIYLLDGSAKQAVTIDAAEITLNVTHGGKGEQFQLAAEPLEGEPAGQSSRFSIADEHLAEDLDAKGATAKLVLSINGKQYTGKLDHHHGDHADHAEHK